METIRLHRHTKLDDISQWSEQPAQVMFEITKASSLAILSEGAAVAQLRQYMNAQIRPKVSLTFSLPPDVEDVQEEIQRIPLLTSLFGLYLIALSSEVQTIDGREVRSTVLKALWSSYLANSGALSSGRHFSIISREPDYPVPKCINPTSSSFPNVSHIRYMVRHVTHRLGRNQAHSFSLNEEPLISYLYEIALNAHEHGRIDHSGHIARGYRGITFERLIINKDDEAIGRDDLIPELKDYISNTFKYSKNHRHLACTISDIGLGIHNTMPLNDGNALDTLSEAFLFGKGRKHKEGESAEGIGLPYALRCAHNLRAFLFVKSSDTLTYCDFSQQQLTADEACLSRLSVQGALARIGTSLTIIWPDMAGLDEQESLPYT